MLTTALGLQGRSVFFVKSVPDTESRRDKVSPCSVPVSHFMRVTRYGPDKIRKFFSASLSPLKNNRMVKARLIVAWHVCTRY